MVERALIWCAVFLLVPSGAPGLARQNPPSSSATSATPDARRRLEIAAVEGALPKIADRGAALFLLATREAELGELDKALAFLSECVSLDEGFDPGDVPAFRPLASDARFRELAARARRRQTRVHRGRVAFTIRETDLFPEGLAADPARHVFYVGSMHRRKIVKITEAGEVSDFVKPDVYGLAPVGGLKVDPADHSIWAASDSAEFLHFDTGGALLGRFSVMDGAAHILNDLVLRDSREIYLTDTRANQVYRFDRGARSFTPLSFHRPISGPNGITLSPDGRLLYVADNLGVIVVDLEHQTTRDVQPGRGNTLAGIDGLYWYNRGLVAVQYGTGSFRVIRCGLSPAGTDVTSMRVLEQRTPLVSFPTTGAVVGARFYYIANTGIGNLENERIVDASKLEPVHIAVVRLQG